MNTPYSFYPASTPTVDGFYLAHDEWGDKWKVLEWRNEWANMHHGAFQGGGDIDYFIPYRIIKESEK